MESIVVSWREILLVGLIILAVYIAEMLLLMRGGWLRGGKPAADGALREELAQLRQRLDVLEQRLNPQPPEPEPEVGRKADASPYNRAIQMARQGFDAARISERCGISRGEADLIVTMHKET